MIKIELMNSLVFGPLTRVLTDIASQRVADVLDGPPVFLPFRLQAQVVEAAARDLGERHLGAMVAARCSYADLDLYGAYVLDAPCLDHALVRAKRALRFILSQSTVSMREVERHVLLSFASGIEDVSGSRRIDEGVPFLMIILSPQLRRSGMGARLDRDAAGAAAAERSARRTVRGARPLWR